MTHCAIVPLITVAHIHLKHILTFSLTLECVLSVFAFLHVSSSSPLPPLPSARQFLQLNLTLQECVTCHPLICWSVKWHQLLSFSSREWCSVFSTSPHSCRETKAEPQHCSFSVFWIFVCLLEIVFVLFFSCLESRNLIHQKKKKKNPKIYYLTTP